MIRLQAFVFCLSSLFSFGYSQNISGTELLDRAIDYHDPQGNWKKLNAKMQITSGRPDKPDRVSQIHINLPKERFQIDMTADGNVITHIMDGSDCSHLINGENKISTDDKEKYRLTCERTQLWRDYYTYLYGLPMKLRDPGTHIDPEANRRSFKGKEYLVLKATYDAAIGQDTWYFYFDPESYAMEVYQFYKDESKKDGEYILLSGEELIEGIRMPKARAWYYNSDDGYLGTDTLESID